jgi:hypothetical protein
MQAGFNKRRLAMHATATSTQVLKPRRQPQPEDVTSCYTDEKLGANAGVTNDYQGDVTRYPSLSTLTTLQLQAIDLLLRGHSVNHVAGTIGITRVTISRWKNHHPAFIAELNRRQQELLSHSALLYQRLLERSLRTLHDVLSGKSADKAALRIAVAIVNGVTSRRSLDCKLGPTDPIAVVNQMVTQEQQAWIAPNEIYLEGCVHNEFVHRLAQVNFNPEPTPGPKPQEPQIP